MLAIASLLTGCEIFELICVFLEIFSYCFVAKRNSISQLTQNICPKKRRCDWLLKIAKNWTVCLKCVAYSSDRFSLVYEAFSLLFEPFLFRVSLILYSILYAGLASHFIREDFNSQRRESFSVTTLRVVIRAQTSEILFKFFLRIKSIKFLDLRQILRKFVFVQRYRIKERVLNSSNY